MRLCACFAPAVSQIPFAGKGVLVKLTCGLRPEAVTLRFLNILSTVVGRAKIQVSHFNYPPFFVFQNFGLYMSSFRIQIGLSIQASVHQAWLDITAICAMLRFPFLRRAYKERNRRTTAGPWLFLNNSRTCCLCSSVPCFSSCPLAMLDDRIPCRSCFSCISSGLL